MSAIQEHRRHVYELATAAFAEHVLKEEAPGRWLCRAPGKQFYWFRVLLAPTAVLLYGDVGEQIFRFSDQDPRDWLRASCGRERIDYDYVLGKATFKDRRFLPAKAFELIEEMLDEEREEDGERLERRKAAAGLLRDIARDGGSDAGLLHEFQRTWYEQVPDCDEVPDPTDWDSQLIYHAEAVNTFARLLERR